MDVPWRGIAIRGNAVARLRELRRFEPEANLSRGRHETSGSYFRGFHPELDFAPARPGIRTAPPSRQGPDHLRNGVDNPWLHAHRRRPATDSRTLGLVASRPRPEFYPELGRIERPAVAAGLVVHHPSDLAHPAPGPFARNRRRAHSPDAGPLFRRPFHHRYLSRSQESVAADSRPISRCQVHGSCFADRIRLLSPPGC